jgi:transposase, IS5 family
MSQISFADAEYAGKRKKTRREVFLEDMELVVPRKVLLKIIGSHYPLAGRGRKISTVFSVIRWGCAPAVDYRPELQHLRLQRD